MTFTFDVRGDLLVDRVVELLRDRIMEGRYAPGEPLARRRLAEELNLGATVVGEALRVLRREGLVSRGRRGEMRVSVQRRSLLLDAFELRYVIDGLAARLAARRGGPPGVALEKALAAQREASASGDSRRFTRADIAFHTALLVRSGNASLGCFTSLVRWTSRNVGWDGRQIRLAVSAHETILAAVRAHDEGEAERAAQGHVCRRAHDARGTPVAFTAAAETRPAG